MSEEGRSTSSESSDEPNVFMELGVDPNVKHFALDEELSLPLRRVFKLQELEGTHETLGLSDIMTMVRGSPDENLPHIKSIYLGLKDPKSNDVGAVGKSEAKERDPRVIQIHEWTPKIPLPLGGPTYSLLRIILRYS